MLSFVTPVSGHVWGNRLEVSGSVALTDAEGYTPDGLSRYIRLYPDCKLLYAQDLSFFNPADIFDLAVKARDVFRQRPPAAK